MRRVTFRVTGEMHSFIQERARVFGSISGYIRHLVMNDMQGNVIFSRRVTVEEQVLVRRQPPALGSGDRLRAELMAELKEKIAKRRVE